ncbi:MAG: amidohydrolase family protein, partial [Luteibaculum sp.]
EQKRFIHTESAAAMLDAIQLKDMLDIPQVVFVGGYEAHMITEQIKEAGIPIVLRRVHELPMHPDDPVHLPYQLPKILSDAGILVALDMEGDMEEINSRNLPFLAGTAAAYGLGYEEALKLITSNTAKILGIEDKWGSLQKGKRATLFISSGNALEPTTSKVLRAFVNGVEVDLEDNKQKRLYKKYSDKYNK